MAMLLELDKAFPYIPLPNYLWLHTTRSVLRAMRREREVYMEGIRGSPLGGGDLGLEVPEVEAAPEGVESSGSVAESRRPPRVIRTYSKKPVGVTTSGTMESGKIGRAHV